MYSINQKIKSNGMRKRFREEKKIGRTHKSSVMIHDTIRRMVPSSTCPGPPSTTASNDPTSSPPKKEMSVLPLCTKGLVKWPEMRRFEWGPCKGRVDRALFLKYRNGIHIYSIWKIPYRRGRELNVVACHVILADYEVQVNDSTMTTLDGRTDERRSVTKRTSIVSLERKGKKRTSLSKRNKRHSVSPRLVRSHTFATIHCTNLSHQHIPQAHQSTSPHPNSPNRPSPSPRPSPTHSPHLKLRTNGRPSLKRATIIVHSRGVYWVELIQVWGACSSPVVFSVCSVAGWGGFREGGIPEMAYILDLGESDIEEGNVTCRLGRG